MLAAIQFPIADARPFASEEGLRLPFPDWPCPSVDFNSQFVHNFGKVLNRRRKPDEAWPDELYFCNAKRGLRFHSLECNRISGQGWLFKPICAYRRLFCDGGPVVRAEVGIAHNQTESNDLTCLSIRDVMKLASSIAQIPAYTPDTQKPLKNSQLILQGKAIAKLYTKASSAINLDSSTALKNSKLVEAGDPQMIFVMDESELLTDQCPDGVIELPQSTTNGVLSYFVRLQSGSCLIPTWIIKRNHAQDSKARSLRICLGRLHSEREVLDRMLKQIKRGRLLESSKTEPVNRIEAYFNKSTRILNRHKWSGIKQTEILAAHDATLSVARPANNSMLISRYEGARRQVWAKIKEFQEERRQIRTYTVYNIENIDMSKEVNVSGTGNIVNVAEYMNNVTNTVTNNLTESKESEEVNALIERLSNELKAIADQTDPEHTKKMGKNLEALSNEVKADEPDRRWYELSLKGIKEAAIAVGEIASPIITTVGKLLPLLVP